MRAVPAQNALPPMWRHRSISEICSGLTVGTLKRKRRSALRRAQTRFSYNLSDLLDKEGRSEAAINCLRSALRAAPDYADAIFNLALLLQRVNKHAEAAEYWRRYLAEDGKSEWAARARRSLKILRNANAPIGVDLSSGSPPFKAAIRIGRRRRFFGGGGEGEGACPTSSAGALGQYSTRRKRPRSRRRNFQRADGDAGPRSLERRNRHARLNS